MKQFFKKIIVSILTWEATVVLKKYKPSIIAITGSVGKTSAKDAIYTVVASAHRARKSQKSFNSELGVPLTILGVHNAWSNPFLWIKNIVEGLLLIVLPFKYPSWLVLEVGADRPGDIAAVAEWLKPDITVMTRFGDVPVHVEFFPSIDDLVFEKAHLAKALKPTGTFIYNHDDKRIVQFTETITQKKISFGFTLGSDIEALEDQVVYGTYDNSALEFPRGILFTTRVSGQELKLQLEGALGKQHVYPLLAACAVGMALRIDQQKIIEVLHKHISPKGRMRLIPGIKNTMIIDDTYNSSPVAVYEALKTLEDIKTSGRKIAVLADMMELGQYSVEEHRRVGEMVKPVADILVTVGIRSRATADVALDAQMLEDNILQFETAQEAGKYLESVVQPGDIILVKGSQSMRMERVVEEIMLHPEDKEKLLVRQDKQWLARK